MLSRKALTMPTNDSGNEPHWIVKHAIKVVVGVIIVGALSWIAANYQEIYDVRCVFSEDPARCLW